MLQEQRVALAKLQADMQHVTTRIQQELQTQLLDSEQKLLQVIQAVRENAGVAASKTSYQALAELSLADEQLNVRAEVEQFRCSMQVPPTPRYDKGIEQAPPVLVDKVDRLERELLAVRSERSLHQAEGGHGLPSARGKEQTRQAQFSPAPSLTKSASHQPQSMQLSIGKAGMGSAEVVSLAQQSPGRMCRVSRPSVVPPLCIQRVAQAASVSSSSPVSPTRSSIPITRFSARSIFPSRGGPPHTTVGRLPASNEAGKMAVA